MAILQHRAEAPGQTSLCFHQTSGLPGGLPSFIMEGFIDLACSQPPVLGGGLTALRISVFWRDPDCQSASREERVCLLLRARLAPCRHRGSVWDPSLEPLTDQWLFCARVASPTAGGWDAKMRRTQFPSGAHRHVGK